MYKPPFTITTSMLNKAVSIGEKISKISSFENLKRMPYLRHNSSIKSIHSSLKIEANSLSLNEVKDIINGKQVIGDKSEIIEVKNAYQVYSSLTSFNPYSEKDLIKAHDIFISSLNESKGYRKHGVGVFDGNKVIFVAPPFKIVPKLMKDLFKWLKDDKETHILIKSIVFHYEFVFIHPFSDGNGRTARFWQNVILNQWNNIFLYLPLESTILEYQEEYYDVIDKCNKKGNSDLFIDFMLDVILKTIDDTLLLLERERNNISKQVKRLLSVMEDDTYYSSLELMKLLNIKSRDTLRNSYLNKALENNLIERLDEKNINSRNQKYIKK